MNEMKDAWHLNVSYNFIYKAILWYQSMPLQLHMKKITAFLYSSVSVLTSETNHHFLKPKMN